jgi:autotransporter strand-loop-strand O-heptosyltransferase
MQVALWIDTPALGDTIAAIPTLRKLSQVYNQPVTVFTSLPSIFEGHPCVKEAFHSDADKSDYKVYRTFAPLVGATYDLKGEKVEFRHSNSEIRQFHAMSLGFNLTPDEMETDLYIEEELELPVKDYVIIHPTHTWATRTWDQANWQELVDRLNDRGIPVVAIGHDSKEVGFYSVQKPVMDINIKHGVNLLNNPITTIPALRWMMNHRAKAVVTMDSGILHIAGTTDVEIIQLGSSIDPKLRAPYRKGSQDYKYKYIAGGCGLFCSSNMAYNVRVHGSLHGVPPQIHCLENKPTMECHPGVNPVFEAVCQRYDVRPKIRLVHLLLKDDHSPERQQRSIDSISQLADRGIEYIQIWNERWKDAPPRETFEYPDQFDKVPIGPGHYGNYRAFVDSGLEHFTEDIDALIFAEGDSFLTKPIDEVVEDINRAYEACELHNISYFSFGSRYSLHDFNDLISSTRYKIGDIHVVNKVIGAQLVMLHNRVQYYCSDRFIHQKWTAADIYLNNIMMGKFNIGIFDQPVALQADGFSAIDSYNKIHADERSRNSKKRILFLAPHLSTGGMPEFLLGRLKALIDEPSVELHVVEFTCYATTYVVQRDQIRQMLGDRFHEIGHLGSMEDSEREERLKQIISQIQPDVIHIEESPEAFDGFNKMSEECQSWIYQSSHPWRIVETCHNIWFNPRENKRISPDAYLFVTPHHTLETFSEEPSEKFEAFYPIIPQTKSELQRRKSLEILELEHLSDAKHLINIGLWTQGKNQGEAVEWARTLEQQYPGQYQFHFIGNQAENFESYWGPIMQDLPPNVHIHGERNDINTFYQLADGVVFNSTWECNPLALRQALGYPIPVMARNLPQYHSMYTGQLTEIQGDTTDPLRLVEALKSPIHRKQNDQAMAKFKQEHLQAYMKTLKGPVIRTAQIRDGYTIQWNNGPTVRSKAGRPLDVEFWADGELVYKSTLQAEGYWCRPADEWFRDWTVKIDGKEHKMELEDKVAHIQFNSGSLGDTLSWVEAAVEFKFKHGLSKLYLSTHKNWLFDQDHYHLRGVEFIAPGDSPEDTYARWEVGVYMEDPPGTPWFPNRNKRDWRKIYLGDIATDHLGLPSIRKAPKLQYTSKHQQDRPYICIATQSTAQAKYWNNPTGWQDLIDHYTAKGYDVYHVSKEGNNDLKGFIQGPEDMGETFALINGAEVFYGISSGLSWLAWCTETPVVMISGFTPEECEFMDDKTLRIINKDVCNSCWAWDHFNRGDWNWCPTGKGNERHFECTKTISASSVIEQVNNWNYGKSIVTEESTHI